MFAVPFICFIVNSSLPSLLLYNVHNKIAPIIAIIVEMPALMPKQRLIPLHLQPSFQVRRPQIPPNRKAQTAPEISNIHPHVFEALESADCNAAIMTVIRGSVISVSRTGCGLFAGAVVCTVQS